MWSSKESEASAIEKTKVLEEGFKNTITRSIPQIPSSARFDGSRITACKAIDSLIQEVEQDVKPQASRLRYKAIQSFCEWNLIILKLSVIGCLFLLSFQCHRIHRGRKEYLESTLRLHGRSK